MDMLRAMELLKKDLIEKRRCDNRLYMYDNVLESFSDGEGIPKCRIIQFFGQPNCGKSLVARRIIERNDDKAFIYISSKRDDISKANFNNAIVFMSNIFEDTINYFESLNKGDVDIVIIDDLNNMLSKEELLSAFTKKLDNREILNKYIKKISLLSVQKDFVVLVFNGINGISNKSRYNYIIEKESVANLEIKARRVTEDYMTIEIVPHKNLMADIKQSYKFIINYNDRR